LHIFVELLGPPLGLGGVTDEQVVLEAGDVRHDGSRAFHHFPSLKLHPNKVPVSSLAADGQLHQSKMSAGPARLRDREPKKE
jgi:hypothetical protein